MADEIAGRARAIEADLIVVGSRGRGPLATSILGSVSAVVIDRAPCPVPVARTGEVKGIVLADDGRSGPVASPAPENTSVVLAANQVTRRERTARESETLTGSLSGLDGEVFHLETDQGEPIIFTLLAASGIQPHHLEGIVRSPVRIEVTIEGPHAHATAEERDLAVEDHERAADQRETSATNSFSRTRRARACRCLQHSSSRWLNRCWSAARVGVRWPP